MQVQHGGGEAASSSPGSGVVVPVVVAPIDRNGEVRMQHFAIVSIMQDTSADFLAKQQPAVIFWGCTETEAEAVAKIKDELSHRIKDIALDVVCMYEWLVVPTDQESPQIKEEWRDEQLNEIMNEKKVQSRKVKLYEQECCRAGVAPACIEIENSAASDRLEAGHIPLDPPLLDFAASAATVATTTTPDRAGGGSSRQEHRQDSQEKRRQGSRDRGSSRPRVP